jgi:hypothetical protein
MPDEHKNAQAGKRSGLSMGCRVAPPPVCLVCGQSIESPSQDSCEHVAQKDTVKYEGVQLIGFSMVPGPTCDTCDTPMGYTGHATLWHCENEDCPDTGNVVDPGFGGVASR